MRARQYVCVELVRARDMERWQRKRQLLDERSGGTEDPAGELLRERLFETVPGQREDARARKFIEEAPAGTGEVAVEEDLRTHWMDRDDQGQRFKEWKKVCSESSEERQADSPLAGPLSCLTVCKQMQHHGGNLKLDSQNWETARHYTGTSTVFDLAPHELRAYATAAEAEIDSMRTRGRYVGRAAEAVAVGGLPRMDDMVTAGVKGAGKDKGKRKAKGGRGGDVLLGAVAAGPPRGHELFCRVGYARPTWRIQGRCQHRVCGESTVKETAATWQAGGR